jgi:reversibly glycosylated polypeptide / UDP-arabinopyranose mutase
MRAAIVVPTIREHLIKSFLAAWKDTFADHLVILVEDNPERTFDVSGTNVKHFCWADIDKILGRDSWIIPRRTDCIRSFGYYQAFLSDVDMIVTLDDDCYPQTEGFLGQHYEKLNKPTGEKAWISTVRGPLPRGVPYHNLNRVAECVVNHGLWTRVPDFDAVTQLANVRFNQEFEPFDQVVPRGTFFPMCGMNLAFKTRMTPAMYFLLMGKDWPFDRFGDIWCGIFLKRICDHLGLAICSGQPWVEHQRASNVWTNLRKELPGYELNETLWQAVDSAVLTQSSVQGCYKELAEKLPLVGDYWDRLRTAMQVWADLFADTGTERDSRESIHLKVTTA